MSRIYKCFSHLDAGESVFFSRELEHVRSKSYDVLFPAFKGRELCPIDHEVGSAQESVVYEVYEEFGLARKGGGSYAQDGPRADVSGTEVTKLIKPLTASYGYTIQELRASQLTGKRLPERKANAARKSVEQQIENRIFSGDSSVSHLGMLNQTSTQTYTTPVGDSGLKTWESKTPNEILVDMHAIANRVVSQTNEVHAPNTLLLPLTSYQLVSNTRIGDGSSETILNFFLATNPYITEVKQSYRCETAGTASSKRAMAYDKNPDMIHMIISQEFESLSPEIRGFEFVVQCHARVGGVVSPYPGSICYGDYI